MKAIYVSDESKLAEAIGRLPDGGNNQSDASWLTFSQNSGLMCFPYSQGITANAYYRHAPGSLDTIAVDAGIRLFRNPWSLAFLVRLNSFLAPDGKLLLPFFPEQDAARKGYWSLAWLEDIFSQQGVVVGGQNLVQFSKAQNMQNATSLLNWYFDDGAGVITEYRQLESMLTDISQERIQMACLHMFEQGYDLCDIKERNLLTQNPEEICKYWLTGLNSKSALMSHIIRNHFPADQELSMVDQGGGPGMLAAELVLNPGINLVQAVNCDIGLANLLIGRRFYMSMKSQFNDRLYYWLGPSEEYGYNRACDIVSCIASLMYVPRDAAKAVLDKAWSALNPGGILVVHENIKADSYKTHRDYHMMFTLDELEALLHRYADTLEYYLSTATLQITREQAGIKSVFRVLQKP